MFTTDEYHRMAAAGILSHDDRVELIDGEIVRMSPIGRSHASCVDRLTALFTRRLRERAIVRVQNPIVLDRYSEPHADLSILKPRADFYAEAHPRSPDVLLVIEVVDTSGSYDRGTKAPALRARRHPRGVAGRRDGCRRGLPPPALRAYRQRRALSPRQRVCPVAFPRTTFRVSEMLG